MNDETKLRYFNLLYDAAKFVTPTSEQCPLVSVLKKIEEFNAYQANHFKYVPNK
jgi:hypothetical protein